MYYFEKVDLLVGNIIYLENNRFWFNCLNMYVSN